MKKRRESVTLSLSAYEKAELEKLALHFECRWGERPNISELLKKIAVGDLVISSGDRQINAGDLPSRCRMRMGIEKIKQGLDDLLA